MADDDLMRLVKDLGAVAASARKNLRTAIEVTARHVKDDARSAVKSSDKSWRGLAGAIDYDISSGPEGVTAEVGYKHGSGEPGNLGNIREFGAPNAHRTVVGSLASEPGVAKVIPTEGRLARPPHSDLRNAMKRNEDDFEKGIAIALDQLLKEHGL